jgi:antibiotic biosynthesis monooxygenase (ABM) superfamily enzyme
MRGGDIAVAPKGHTMTAFNLVRFRVKPGRDEAFIEAHRRANTDLKGAKGFRRASLLKTGERNYAIAGEWDSFESLAAARPQMIAMLDSFRAELEDLGNGLGVTDPVSGSVVLEIKA